MNEGKLKYASDFCYRRCGNLAYDVKKGRVTVEQAYDKSKRIGQQMIGKFGVDLSIKALGVTNDALLRSKGIFMYDPEPEDKELEFPITIDCPAMMAGIYDFFKSKWGYVPVTTINNGQGITVKMKDAEVKLV